MVLSVQDNVDDSMSHPAKKSRHEVAGYDLYLHQGQKDVRDRLLNAYRIEAPHIFPAGHPIRGTNMSILPSRDTNYLVKIAGVNLELSEIMAWFERSRVDRRISKLHFFPSNGKIYKTKEELFAAITDPSFEVPKGPVRLSCTPIALAEELTVPLETSWKLHPKTFDHVLQVVEVIDEGFRFHIIPPQYFFRTPPTGGPRHETSKAMQKVEEALDVIGWTGSDNGETAAKTGVAIDLGASPGAWTQYLSRRCRKVVAIDPAALNPTVLALPNVFHIQKKAEESAEEMKAILGEEDCALGVDLMVCDMNRPPHRMLEIVKDCMHLVKEGATVILTLKYKGKGQEKKTDGGINILERMCPGMLEDVKVHWLLANTVAERTIIAKKAKQQQPKD